jgi:hypothetical protein
MFKHSILEIGSLFANIAASFITWYALYNSIVYDPYYILHSILILGFPFFLISCSLLLWSFQHYLAHCYRFRDYRFTVILLPLLLGTQDNPNAPTYSLWFHISAFNLMFSLPIVIARLHLSKPPASKEISKEKRGL